MLKADMLTENMLFAQKLLQDALLEYEGNGTRYEPADRQNLIDLIAQLDKLRKKLAIFMANLPFLDHHPIDTEIEASQNPILVSDLFTVLDNDQYISPLGPLKHSLAYHELKKLFGNTRLSIEEASHLLHREESN
jgi:hypothetical protein